MESVQSQVGQGFKQLDLLKDQVAYSKVSWQCMIFKGLFQPKPFYDYNDKPVSLKVESLNDIHSQSWQLHTFQKSSLTISP